MAKLQPGTRQWFEIAQRNLADSARALQSIRIAQSSGAALVDGFGGFDGHVRAALFTSLVVNYCRPFVPNRTEGGSLRTYPRRNVQRANGFDVQLHNQLLELRDKMVAHSDDDYLAAEFSVESALIAVTDDPSISRKVPMRLSVAATALWGVGDVETTRLYAKHVEAAAAGAEEHVRKHLQEYFRSAMNHPDTCPDMESSGADAAVTFTLAADEAVSTPSLLQFDPKTLVRPVGIFQRDHFLFQFLRFDHKLEGECRFSLPNGSNVVLSVSQRGDDHPHADFHRAEFRPAHGVEVRLRTLAPERGEAG